MGGEHDRLSAAEAASVLGWWLEAGVDVAIQEQPRAWLGAAAASTPEAHVIDASESIEEVPASLDAFRSWLGATPTLPFAKAHSRRVLPIGAEAAEIMLLFDMPSAEDVAEGQPIAGPAWELTERMLAAIGFNAEQAYVGNISCVHTPGSRLTAAELEACAGIARRQIALAKPKRLLLLGDGPSKALLGKPATAARGHVHKIEGVRTVATFHPRFLLDRPSNKALAWGDLLLLMEDEV
ncbi:uracil-DNA glycosylase [Sphingomonas daechungensis]|uniref:uracil-DNA glycosylase n=1 Tax=Sphingomonas daechungensis TaxID=1176646 RepID=UPI00378423D2